MIKIIINIILFLIILLKIAICINKNNNTLDETCDKENSQKYYCPSDKKGCFTDLTYKDISDLNHYNNISNGIESYIFIKYNLINGMKILLMITLNLIFLYI